MSINPRKDRSMAKETEMKKNRIKSAKLRMPELIFGIRISIKRATKSSSIRIVSISFFKSSSNPSFSSTLYITGVFAEGSYDSEGKDFR